MTGVARRSLVVWLLAVAAGAVIVWNSRFVADMSFFLPVHPGPGQQVLVDQISTGAVSRLLILAIAGGDARQRAALSRDLRRRLAAMPGFVAVRNGEAGAIAVDRDFLIEHR